MLLNNYKIRMLYSTIVLYLFPLIFISFIYLNHVSLVTIIFSILVTLLFTVYGYNVGLHYTFTHRIFKYSRITELLLMYISTISACASPISWAASHNAHHKFVETNNDPHPPKILKWKIFFSYFYETTKIDIFSIRHLVKDKVQIFIDSDFGFWLTTLSYPVLCSVLFGFEGLVFFWMIPLWYVAIVTLIFILNHNHDLDEQSKSGATNSLLLNLISLGDGNHLEHHRNFKSCGKLIRFYASLIR